MATPGGGFDPVPGGPTEPAGPAGPSGPGGPADVGLAPNVAGALCYLPLCCLNVVWAVYAVVVEKRSRFVRFHAFQSLLFYAACFAALTVTYVLSLLLSIFWILFLLVSVIAFVGSLFLAFKAYSNESFELPQLGVLARQWS
jgi:uncharacterized membrane protein